MKVRSEPVAKCVFWRKSALVMHPRAKYVVGAWIVVAGLSALPVFAETLVGRVVGVSDGDTITVLDARKNQHRVRLAGIDAPEKGQPFGSRAKQSLSSLSFGKAVRVEWYKVDRYRRIIGTVWVSPEHSGCAVTPNCPKTVDTSLEQISAGLAWHYVKYAHEQPLEERNRYVRAEREARKNKVGLWAEPGAIAPWEWRRRR